MSESAAAILERFRFNLGKDIDLTLRAPYRALLEKRGNPQNKLQNVVHVAGTNGKGSTCAFMRAALEAAGLKVHVYTSPHLVSIHERIRVAGNLIPEAELAEILALCEKDCEKGTVSFFEASTAAAFTAFARHPADVTLLEVGLGGRLDATNVIERPALDIVTRLSFDHRDYLGNTMAEIACEKAGIMRAGVPCFTAPQPSTEALAALEKCASAKRAPLYLGGRDWRLEIFDTPTKEESFRFEGRKRQVALPVPALLGRHQFWNAGLALAALEELPFALSDDHLRAAMRNVAWPARLQKIESGSLAALLPKGSEIWLDGGHNDSAGEVLGRQIALWAKEEPDRPLHLLFGMLTTKDPQEFLKPMAPYIASLQTVAIPNEPLAETPEKLALEAQKAGVKNASVAGTLKSGLEALAKRGGDKSRVLICGSLYLAGSFLADNGKEIF